MSKKRFYISTQGVDEKARREAIHFACQLAETDSEITRIVLLIHTKKILAGLKISSTGIRLKNFSMV
jgi:hypothetical protein